MEGRGACARSGEQHDERLPPAHFGVGWLRLLALVSLSAARLVSAFAASQFFVIAGLLHKRSAQSGSIWQRYRCSKFDKWHLRSSSSGFWGGRPTRVPPPIYEYDRKHGRLRTRLPAHHAGPRLGAKQTTLLARRLADATQIRLVRAEADPQARRPEVALQRLLEAPLQGFVGKQFVVALRNFKNEVLVVAS